MDFNKPLVGATKILIERLGSNYMITPQDLIRANYVHLVCLTMIEKEPGKTYGYYVQTAIERLTLDMNFEHHDPYELWIDAGYFDPKLNELDKTLISII